MTRRIRLSFNTDLTGVALPRSSLILLPDVNTIADVSSLIRDRYFVGVPDIGLRIEIGGFTIDQRESAAIIRDEDTLSVVVVAAQQPEISRLSEPLSERALKKIEKHAIRRDKQHAARRLSKKTKGKGSVVELRSVPSRVAITSDSSNSECPASNEISELPRSIDKPEAISISAQSGGRREPSGSVDKPVQPLSFSRVATGSVKPLPRGHFRFDGQDGNLEAIPAETTAPICAARDGKSIERAKRLGSFYFKSTPTSQPSSAPSRGPRMPFTKNQPAQEDLSAVQPSSSNKVSEVVQGDIEMTVPSPDLVDKRPDRAAFESELNAAADVFADDHDAHTAILETISTRGANFFAPRTLGRFGLQHSNMESDDVAFQTHCESLPSITDLLSLMTGSEIAFRRLEIVNWAPQISSFKKYRILELDADSQEATLVTSEDQEESVKFHDMHDVKLLDDIHSVSSNTREQAPIDNDIAAALQAKREAMLAKAQQV